MLKSMLSAAAITLLAFSPAAAMPTAAPAGLAHAVNGDGLVQEAQHNRRASDRRRPAWRHSRTNSSRYRAGRRYSAPPRGYRRYTSRPSYWQNRHCVQVGPLWFCPP